jgi:hypothetical protein
MLRFVLPAALLSAAAPALAQGADGQLVRDICLAEARARGIDLGATDVQLGEVRKLDARAGGTGMLDAAVTVVTRDGRGEQRTARRRLACETRDGQVTAFRMD